MEQSVKILSLYDTILGKFKFFREFVKILLQMSKNIEELKQESSDKSTLLVELKEEIEGLKEKVSELEDEIKSIAQLDRDLNHRSPRDIMTDIYNSYNRDDN